MELNYKLMFIPDSSRIFSTGSQGHRIGTGENHVTNVVPQYHTGQHYTRTTSLFLCVGFPLLELSNTGCCHIQDTCTSASANRNKMTSLSCLEARYYMHTAQNRQCGVCGYSGLWLLCGLLQVQTGFNTFFLCCLRVL